MVITKREDVTKQGFCSPPRRRPLGFLTNEPQRTSAGSRKTLMMTLAQEGDADGHSLWWSKTLLFSTVLIRTITFKLLKYTTL